MAIKILTQIDKEGVTYLFHEQIEAIIIHLLKRTINPLKHLIYVQIRIYNMSNI